MLWCYQWFYWCVSLLIATNNDQGNWVSEATAAVYWGPDWKTLIRIINNHHILISDITTRQSQPASGGVVTGEYTGGVTQRSCRREHCTGPPSSCKQITTDSRPATACASLEMSTRERLLFPVNLYLIHPTVWDPYIFLLCLNVSNMTRILPTECEVYFVLIFNLLIFVI